MTTILLIILGYWAFAAMAMLMWRIFNIMIEMDNEQKPKERENILLVMLLSPVVFPTLLYLLYTGEVKLYINE